MSVQVPKGYKQTEVGVIPEDWELSALEKLTDPNRPISYGIVQTGPNVLNGIKCLRVVDIDNGKIKRENLITTTKEISDSYKRTILKNGDLVIPLRGKVGEVGLIEGDLEGSNLTRGVGLIALRKDFDSLFFKQNIASIESRRRLEQSMNGSALQEIPIATLRAFKIAYPKEIVEQQAIAEALSDADALIESLEQLIAKKRQIKQGAMQELLTGQRRLPGFSGEWIEKSLGSVISGLNAGVSVNSEECDSPLNTGKPCILKTSAVFDGIFIPEECKLVVNGDIHRLSTKIKKDTLVVSRMNTPNLVGEVGYVKRDYDNLYLPDRLWMASAINNEIVHIRWLSYIMSFGRNKEKIKELATGTSGSMKNISKDAILSMKFIFPEIQEQVGIGDVLADMDKEIESLEAQLFKARQIKQSMMQELLTGCIRLI